MHSRKHNRIELLDVNHSDHSLKSKVCKTRFPKISVHCYSLTSIDGDKVTLAGGTMPKPMQHILTTVFEGSMNENGMHINWKLLPDMKRGRYDHTAFL